jgi:chemotaxis protein methyltransferase CheR
VVGPAVPPPRLSDAEYRLFAELLRAHCGLHFGEDLRYLLEKRIARRVEALGLASFASYHFLLRRGPGGDEELARLVDDLVTNETYFLRERNQLAALVYEILPELRERARGAPVNVWSAGCSSGEEPYSIVMLVLEAGLEPGRDLRVYASDISRSMLQRARLGVYRETSFRSLEAPLRERYFVEKDGVHRIRDEVKRHVCFAHLNLLERERIGLLASMDVILCRNVIIYFDLETKRRVIQTFAEKLRPGGYLLLGHSESLINLSTAFELRHLRHDMVYRKPGPGESLDPWHASAAAALREPAAAFEGGA